MTNNQVSVKSDGGSFFGTGVLVFLAFLVLRWVGVGWFVHMPWVWMWSPVWIGAIISFGIPLLVGVVTGLIFLIAWAVLKIKGKR